MRIADKWKDYELIDTSSGERLERWGGVILIRPDPQVIWRTEKKHPLWKQYDARYIRSSSGGGNWDIHKKIPDSWKIQYENLKFNIKPMGFKHTGLFPEQAVNWDRMADLIRGAGRPINVLNLFAYTGGATIVCLSAGAHVTHVDASKGMTAWAKENAAASGMSRDMQRWIVEDCLKFVAREARRGNKYDAILMDPPSYGRGPAGEVWHLEDSIHEMIIQSAALLSDNPLFFVVNSYSTGLSSSVMGYIASVSIKDKWRNMQIDADEIGLPVTSTGLALPCGSTCFCQNDS